MTGIKRPETEPLPQIGPVASAIGYPEVEHSSLIEYAGRITFVEETFEAYYHDGSTPGGIAMVDEDDE